VGERATRRLAAILAADVVGYSRLIEADEAEAAGALAAAPNDLDILNAAAIGMLAASRYEPTIEIVRKTIALGPCVQAGNVGNSLGPAL